MATPPPSPPPPPPADGDPWAYQPTQGPPPWPGSGWPQGPAPYWGAPQPPPPMNPLAVGALVTSLLCLAPVAVVLGIVALVQTRRTGARGRGLAIAGTAIGGAALVLAGGLITVGVLLADEPERDRDGRVTASGYATPLEIEEGDCFNTGRELTDLDELAPARSVELVPCAQVHDAEAYWVFSESLSGPYPGEAALERSAMAVCEDKIDDYVLDTWSLPDSVEWYYYIPVRVGWDHGDREITCFLGDPRGRLTGSLYSDVLNLSEDQYSFLTATNETEELFNDVPEDGADLEEYKDWAGLMAQALQNQESELRAHDWQEPGAREAVDELVAENKAAIPHWQKVAEADPGDEDALWEHLHAAEEHDGVDATVEIRRVLHLATGEPTQEA